MKVRVLPTSELAAAAAAVAIAQLLPTARGSASVAFSGGSTARPLLSELAAAPVAWSLVQVFQVDERVAPDGDEARNLTWLQRDLLERLAAPAPMVHPMPVTAADVPSAAAAYDELLPGVLDVVHLGMGADGHTASLVPGDPVLDDRRRRVAVTRAYQGHVRMTLTYRALDAAANLVWFVTGRAKAQAVRRLVDGDPSIPAGRVEQDRAVLILDAEAASAL